MVEPQQPMRAFCEKSGPGRVRRPLLLLVLSAWRLLLFFVSLRVQHRGRFVQTLRETDDHLEVGDPLADFAFNFSTAACPQAFLLILFQSTLDFLECANHLFILRKTLRKRQSGNMLHKR